MTYTSEQRSATMKRLYAEGRINANTPEHRAAIAEGIRKSAAARRAAAPRCIFEQCGEPQARGRGGWLDPTDVYCRRHQNMNRRYQSYGTTLAEVRERYLAIDGKCETCAIEIAWTSDGQASISMHVDHCHTTGKFRGLLCRRCNSTLGYMNDDVEVLRRMADYIERQSTVDSCAASSGPSCS